MSRLRPFRPSDRSDCLALFDSNVPEFFRPDERRDFRAFLDELPGPFVVIADGGIGVVACGGIAREADGRWSLCWTVVDRARHGAGLGRTLVDDLLEGARERGATRVRLETIPATEGFFLRLGFRTVERTPGHYGPDLDRVEMERELRG